MISAGVDLDLVLSERVGLGGLLAFRFSFDVWDAVLEGSHSGGAPPSSGSGDTPIPMYLSTLVSEEMSENFVCSTFMYR